MCPLKEGDVLFVDAPDAEVNNMQFGFAIAFSEPGVAEGESVTDTIKALVPLVESIIRTFPGLP
jgi:hypothetical protein